ncbi:MAG TPA: hypothetical protein ENJ21_02215 [Chromatiaceae bacterium]|nr:hypothetical protein [Chromatiaceae bacterium]
MASFRNNGQGREGRPQWPKIHGRRVYFAETSEQNVVMSVNPELGRPEHDEYRWLEAPDAKRLLGPRPRAILAWAVGVSGRG